MLEHLFNQLALALPVAEYPQRMNGSTFDEQQNCDPRQAKLVNKLQANGPGQQ